MFGVGIPEIIIIVVMLLIVIFPWAAVALVIWLLLRTRDQRISELEKQVKSLEDGLSK